MRRKSPMRLRDKLRYLCILGDSVMAKLKIPSSILAVPRYGRFSSLSGRTRTVDHAQVGAYPLVTQHAPPTPRPAASNGPQSPATSPPGALSTQTCLEPPSAPSRPLRPRRRPKPRKRPPARLPCNTWPRFLAYHSDDPRSIARSEERRLAAVRLTRAARDEIDPEAAFRLSACNYAARIAYAQIATDHVTRFTASLPRSTPVFWSR